MIQLANPDYAGTLFGFGGFCYFFLVLICYRYLINE